MKIKIITTGLLCLLLSACQKTFLDLPSETSLSTPIYFKTQEDFQQAINGAYAPLRNLYNGLGDQNPNNISGPAWVMGEMHSDNSRYIFNPNFRATIDQENNANFVYDATSAIVTTHWTLNYSIIASANQILSSIDAGTFSSTTIKDNIRGQAHFLRAFCYFNLVQYFGKVPLHLKPVGSLSETAFPPSTTEAVYTQIISDATTAAGLLLDKATQEAGRVTSGTAKTLLANVYIVQKNWAAAQTQLNSVISSGQYSLMSSYGDIYKPANKNNSESVFEIQYLESPTIYASNFIYNFLPLMSGASVTALTGAAGEQAIVTETYNTPSPEIIAAYENGDLRKAASIDYALGANGVVYPFIKKYLHTHSSPGFSNDNWPVYRYAEVLLFLAEALNEQGTGDPLIYLNRVRNRAGLANSTAVGQAAIRTAIRKERRVELAFENKRWLDLVRTGEATTVISAYGASILANPQNYYFPAGFGATSNGFATPKLLFPYPASEAALNPALK